MKEQLTIEIKTNILTFLHFFVFLLASWAAPILGQVPANEVIPPKQIEQWSELGALNISSNGKWASVQHWAENGPDTLKVISTLDDKHFTFPNSYGGTFSADGKWFAFTEEGKGFGILELDKNKVNYTTDGNDFKFSEDGKTVAITIKSKNTKVHTDLLIRRLEKKDSLLLKEVANFKFNPHKNEIVYVTHKNMLPTLEVLHIESWNSTLISNQANTFKHLVWSESGKSIFFIENDSILCSAKLIKPLALVRQGFKNFTHQKMVPGVFQPFFSKDDKQIFFYLQTERLNKKATDTFSNVQVWKGTDKMIYPRNQRLGAPEDWQMLYLWEPDIQRLEKIGSGEKPNVVIAPNSDYAIRYNILDYAPEYLQFPTADMYLKNLKTGVEKLLIKKQQTGIGYIQFSPNGKQLCFFNGKDWILYDFISEEYTNLTMGINSFFYDVDRDTPEPPQPYGMVGWTNDEKGVVVYDKNDLWFLSFDKQEQRHLTNGNQTNTIYRVNENLISAYPPSRFSEFNGNEVDLSRNLILFANRADKTIGYEILSTNGNIIDFAISHSKTSKLQKAKDTDTYVFSRQTGEIPPQVFVKKTNGNEIGLIYQSNPQYTNHSLGKRKLITYDAGQWKNLNGILYYPDHYDPTKNYPMVTKIYEIQSNAFYDYKKSNLYSRDGYNPRNLTAAGYFVFEPDIKYRIGDPGVSASECVIAAVEKVLEGGAVDRNRLGLIGHSYGGYETAFIIGKTDMFAAAVSGAPVTDMLSYYHTVRWENGKPNIWRMEHQQWRMGQSYYEDPEGYRRNSPIEFVKNINTPLMIWEGDQDTNIDWHQSIEMYLALRRLKKEVILCLYTEEFHDLNEPENQKDLSLRIISWFDRYLK